MAYASTPSERRPSGFRGIKQKRSQELIPLVLGIGLAIILLPLPLVLGATPASAAQVYDQNGCLICHASPEIRKGDKPLTVSYETLQEAAHRTLDCLECHGQANATGAGALSDYFVHSRDPEGKARGLPDALKMNKLTGAQKCGECHVHQYSEYLNSVHGKAVALGYADGATEAERQAAEDSAGCLDCHSATQNAHNVIRVLDPDSSVYRKNIPQTCSERCHANEDVVGSYGLNTYVYDGYESEFHGKANRVDSYKVGDRRAATCVDCHTLNSSHDIASAGTVTADSSCGKCHDYGDSETVQARVMDTWMGHTEVDSESAPTVYVIRWVYWILVPGTLLFGITHVILVFLKWLRTHNGG